MTRMFLRCGLALCFFVMMLLSATVSNAVAQTPQAAVTAVEPPFVVEYYYKARWGFADEFITLFKKNHYPILKKQIETGRFLRVTVDKPRYHATEDGRWDYRVTIVYKNVAAAHESGGDAAIIKQLFPDQETFKREEQRRFEILLAHWDLPLTVITLDR